MPPILWLILTTTPTTGVTMATAAPTKPKRKYTRRKIMTDVATTPPIPTESSFMEGLRKNLAEREQQIKDEINAIDNQMTTLTDQRISLVDEQEKVTAGIKALGEKK